MQPDAYRAYTHSLEQLARHDPRIHALVVLGSTAATDHQPDAWSDHDFWLVVETGTHTHFHDDLSWLPQFERITLTYRETQHGWKALFDDGHVLEFAIFQPHELDVVRFHHYRVPVDKTDVAAHLTQMKATFANHHTPPAPPEIAKFLLFLLVIGMGRYHRGEQISGHLFIKHDALTHLLQLIRATVPPQHPHLEDTLNASRRIEQTHPQYTDRLHTLITAPVPHAAARILEMALELHPDISPETVATVRRVIDRA
ncbi:MAG: aminoglycoside 6-adenylyltransferase [Chloroflexota bacterium]